MQNNNISDLIIIGGGPIGMFAAYYAGMRELKTKLIESLPQLGGQIDLMYPEKIITDLGTVPQIKGKQLITNLEEQLDIFKTDITTNETVLEIEKNDDYFTVITNKDKYYARTILLTSGQGIFEPRKLGIHHNKEYEKTNLHYYVKNLECYRDQKIAVLGGGDSAVDWALMLEGIADKVYLIHRRQQFRAHEASVSQLKSSSIEKLTPYQLESIAGDTTHVQELTLKERHGDEKITLPIDFLIVNYGFHSDSLQLKKWGIDTQRAGAHVSQNMSTNIPGVFAAGDAASFNGKVKLLATGFGEVPTAINSIVRYLNRY